MKERMENCFKTMACLSILLAAPALAQDHPSTGSGQGFPSRPIRWIVPAPPGGGTDAVSRIVAPKLIEMWKQQVVIDNRGGVQGSIAHALAAKSAPDGYTILFGFSGLLAVNPHIYSQVGYDSLRDFAAITRLTQQPMILTAHP
jgi:tripartite-type tricarboxylate transporter receptor subunit TctC